MGGSRLLVFEAVVCTLYGSDVLVWADFGRTSSCSCEGCADTLSCFVVKGVCGGGDRREESMVTVVVKGDRCDYLRLFLRRGILVVERRTVVGVVGGSHRGSDSDTTSTTSTIGLLRSSGDGATSSASGADMDSLCQTGGGSLSSGTGSDASLLQSTGWTLRDMEGLVSEQVRWFRSPEAGASVQTWASQVGDDGLDLSIALVDCMCTRWEECASLFANLGAVSPRDLCVGVVAACVWSVDWSAFCDFCVREGGAGYSVNLVDAIALLHPIDYTFYFDLRWDLTSLVESGRLSQLESQILVRTLPEVESSYPRILLERLGVPVFDREAVHRSLLQQDLSELVQRLQSRPSMQVAVLNSLDHPAQLRW